MQNNFYSVVSHMRINRKPSVFIHVQLLNWKEHFRTMNSNSKETTLIVKVALIKTSILLKRWKLKFQGYIIEFHKFQSGKFVCAPLCWWKAWRSIQPWPKLTTYKAVRTFAFFPRKNVSTILSWEKVFVKNNKCYISRYGLIIGQKCQKQH